MKKVSVQFEIEVSDEITEVDVEDIEECIQKALRDFKVSNIRFYNTEKRGKR